MTNGQPAGIDKGLLHGNLRALCAATSGELADALGAAYTDDAELSAFHPVNDARGRAQIGNALWRPLREALPDMERRDTIVAAGVQEDRHFAALLGAYQGTFAADLFDIPATHGVVHLRFGEIHELRENRIRRSFVIVDLLDLMRQAGVWPIAPSVGAEVAWPGPATPHGLALDRVDAERGAESLAPVLGMHEALFAFDGKNLESMDHTRYWTENFMWYGPSGIGTTRGLAGFRAHHQIPFLRAFPDRRGGKHIAKIADGDFVVTGGWPSVIATHTGSDWLGLPPTGKAVNMRVMDFYRVEGGLIAENWVPIDIIDILRQLGVDVFDRVRHRRGEPRTSL